MFVVNVKDKCGHESIHYVTNFTKAKAFFLHQFVQQSILINMDQENEAGQREKVYRA